MKNTLIHNCIGSHTNCFMSLLGQSSVTTNFEKALHINIVHNLQVFSMLIVDQHTFEVVHCHTFMQQEYACSIMSCKLGEDNTPYYVVGTGFIHPEESEPKTGRLIVFSWADGKLTQVRHVVVMMSMILTMMKFL